MKKRIVIEVTKYGTEFHIEGLHLFEVIGLLTAYKNIMEVEHLRSIAPEPVKTPINKPKKRKS